MTSRSASVVGVLALLVASGGANAQPTAPRVAVARSSSPAAAFSARAAAGTVFRSLPANDDLFTGDTLVCLPGATLATKTGAITMKSLADFDARSPLPILETAFTLVEPKDADLDLVLDRGRVDLTNTKPEGAATARVRFWDQSWTIVLDTPKTRVAVELCGRWPAGTRFAPAEPKADPAKAPVPVASLVLLVLSGSASVDVGGVTLALTAPPGPTELRWNSVTGTRKQPLKLDSLPAWADPETGLSEDGKKIAAACEKFRAARAADAAKALDTFLGSDDLIELRVALLHLGALDDLDRLGKALASAKTIEEWDFGVTVLRHWIGRARGQDQRYYSILTSVRGYTVEQAKTIIRLLIGFSEDEIAEPETYEVLIDYLTHEKPAIRNLAAWHLVRLVPQGKSIPYRPDGTFEDAEKAAAAWKKLIPGGQLPPPTKKE